MKPEMKKLIIANLPYLLFVYLFGKLGQAYRLAEGIDLSQKLLHFADGCAAAFESAAPSFHLFDLLIGVAGAAALRLMVYCKGKNAKKYRKGVEYGSARWGGPKDIAPYIDPNFDNNILLTQTERLTMNNRPKDPKTARNKNVLVIGGSGSGKTRFFVKPNLMQCVSKDYPTSFVIGYNFLIGDTKKYKAFPWLAISNMDEQKLTVCEELMKIQIAFFEELGMQKIADHCVRIMEDYRKGIGKQKESDCR